MKEERLTNILNSLDEHTIITLKVDENIEQINRIKNEAPIDVINSFKRYTQPQKNIEKVLKFYKTFIKCIEEITIKIKECESEEVPEIEKCIQLVESYNYINERLTELHFYDDIVVVKNFSDKTYRQIKNLVTPVYTIFFQKFLKSDDEKLSVMSEFLIKIDESSFLQNYLKILFHKYSTKKGESKISSILDKMRSIELTFKEISETNSTFLDDKNAAIINKQLQQLLLIDLKESSSRALLNLSNKYKHENVILACEFYIRLQDPILMTYFDEFNIEVLKIINNLILSFIKHVQCIKSPQKGSEHEEFIYFIYRILTLFEDKKLHTIFIALKFEYRNYKEMKNKMIELAFERVFTLSEEYKGIQKDVYLINNLVLIQFFCKEYKEQPLNTLIDGYVEEIIKIWSKECQKRNGKDVTKFLDVNFEIQREYTLPQKIRDELLPEIRKIIEELLVNSQYKGKMSVSMKINELFGSKADESKQTTNK